MDPQHDVFEESERDFLRDLANKMTITSWVLYFAGFVSLGANGSPSVGSAVLCILLIILGFLNSRAASSFTLVASASGNHLEFLLAALKKLRHFYSMISILVATTVILWIIAAIVMVAISLNR